MSSHHLKRSTCHSNHPSSILRRKALILPVGVRPLENATCATPSNVARTTSKHIGSPMRSEWPSYVQPSASDKLTRYIWNLNQTRMSSRERTRSSCHCSKACSKCSRKGEFMTPPVIFPQKSKNPRYVAGSCPSHKGARLMPHSPGVAFSACPASL